MDHFPDRPAVQSDFYPSTPAQTMAHILMPHGRQGQGLMRGMWAKPTETCGCSPSEELIVETGEATHNTEKMELEEGPPPAPPEQTEVAVTDEGMEMEGEEIRALDTSADSEFSILDSSVPSPDYSPPDDPSRIPEQLTIGPDHGVAVRGSQTLVRAKLPGCFTAFRVFHLEDPPFNRDWMLDSLTEAESLELAAAWLILRLRANQSVDPGLTAPVWYPAQLLGFSTPTLTDRFDYLRMQALRAEPRGAPPYRMLDCFVSAGRVRSHQSLKKLQSGSWLGRFLGRELQPSKLEMVVTIHQHLNKDA